MNWDSTLYDEKHDFVSKFGEGILSYLQPQTDEHILDLGCGTGDLAYQIHEAGAKVIGVDNSSAMIEQAKSKFPGLDFRVANAAQLPFEAQFDAIFSNAVLHWVLEAEQAVQAMHLALKPKGRIVLEFGGKGNVSAMRMAMREVLAERDLPSANRPPIWYFPSIGEYASLLEKYNFRLIRAEHFDRNTPLVGEEGMKNWFRMFGDYFFEEVPEQDKEDILQEVQERLRATHCIDGAWYGDYKRIRIVAIKQA